MTIKTNKHEQDHQRWAEDIKETQGVLPTYPIVADWDRKIAWNYGMLDQSELDSKNLPLTVRAVFIIDPKKTIQLILV